MHRNGLVTALIYSLAAAASSWLWLTPEVGTWPQVRFAWPLLFGAPLLLVFAYPRYLFAASLPPGSHRFDMIFHGIGAVMVTVAFAILGSAFWNNPLRDADSMAVALIPLILVPLFVVAALFLLLRGTSWLARAASFLFWPYWLLLALTFVGRFFQATTLRTVFCFACFVAPALFAFAAGAIPFRPGVAHRVALAGSLSLPWVYWTILENRALGNVWIFFNVPDRELRMYNGVPPAALTILGVALTVLAISVAAVRLLPAGWKVLGRAASERTWPALVLMLLFLIVWFGESVMPYRIPGAVDYATWPIFQILHIEKHGLQFHERCVSLVGYRDKADWISFSRNDRRLFQYRFMETQSKEQLPAALAERVQALIHSSRDAEGAREQVKPLRTWNAEGWYVSSERGGLKVYTTDKGVGPPPEVMSLFNDLERLPRTREAQSDRKDVCLGFCYDPLSELGALLCESSLLQPRDGRSLPLTYPTLWRTDFR